MPNVEIHGLYLTEAEDLRGRIFGLFQDKPYVEEMVVTIHPTAVKDVHGDDQPYLRLANSDQSHTEEILGRLRTLGIGIEHLKLEGFIPKQEVEDSS